MPAHETLRLHVPEPEVRPGDEPDFSKVEIPKAGSVPRPPVDVDPRDIRELAFSIIRVLNRQGEAVGPWAGTLTTAELLEGMRHMMTLRIFDARMQTAQRHERPDLPAGGAADRRRLSNGRDDEPDLFE